MNSSVERAVEDVLGARVKRSSKMKGGVNEVYRVETEGGAVVLKAFSYAGWPEDGKLPWVERQLLDYEIPHARMLYYSREAAHFPHGFMISEYVEGVNAVDELNAGRLSVEAYCAQAGSLLRHVHEVPAGEYGYLNGGLGMYDSLAEFKLTHEVRERLDALGDVEGFGEDLYERVERKVLRQLAPFEGRLRPVLNHGDASPQNAVLTTTPERLLLVDWDESVAGAWVTELAVLSYWFRYLWGGAHDARAVRAGFMRGYGGVEFSEEEIDSMEDALHVVYTVDLLPFYHAKADAAAFSRTSQRLSSLLA